MTSGSSLTHSVILHSKLLYLVLYYPFSLSCRQAKSRSRPSRFLLKKSQLLHHLLRLSSMRSSRYRMYMKDNIIPYILNAKRNTLEYSLRQQEVSQVGQREG